MTMLKVVFVFPHICYFFFMNLFTLESFVFFYFLHHH